MVSTGPDRPTGIVKRDGRIEPFDPGRIEAAARKALLAAGEASDSGGAAAAVAAGVVEKLVAASRRLPHLEEVQDLERIYPPEVRDAHKSGDMHVHDLNLTAPYCMGWDLQQLLLEGFNGVPGYTEANPPKHLRSALGQLYNFIYTLQGETAGANAVSNFDTLFAPYVRADNLGYDQVKQAVQEFVFNQRTHQGGLSDPVLQYLP